MDLRPWTRRIQYFDLLHIVDMFLSTDCQLISQNQPFPPALQRNGSWIVRFMWYIHRLAAIPVASSYLGEGGTCPPKPSVPSFRCGRWHQWGTRRSSRRRGDCCMRGSRTELLAPHHRSFYVFSGTDPSPALIISFIETLLATKVSFYHARIETSSRRHLLQTFVLKIKIHWK